MGRYLVGRLLQAVLVLALLLVAVFFLIRLVPGDPVRIVLGPRASQASVDIVRHQLGLDRSTLSQFGSFASGAVHFDFGRSIVQSTPVSTLIAPRIAPSLFLIGYGLLVAFLIAIPLALVSALHKDRPSDHAIRGGSTIALAMPPFWLGILLIYFVGLKLGLFPTSGYGQGFWDHLRSLTLPAVTLGVSVSPVLLRTLRSSLLETFGEGYVEAALAHGLTKRRVLYRHVLRNSLAATITVAGVLVGALLSYAVVVESVFGIAGLGSLLVQSVSTRDFPTVQGLTFLFALCVVVVSVVTDVVYVVLDPRIKL